MRRSIRYAVFFPALAALLGLTSSRALAADDPFAITCVRVFNGSQVVPDATVVVRDGTIRAVGADVPVPAGTTIIDGRSKTLLPGLIDAHTHTFTPEHLRAAVVFGVTTELDMFTLTSFAQVRRAEQAAGKADDRADLFSAGTLVTAPGGHGTEYGLTIPTIKAPGEAENFVAARITEGSDYIKIVYDDGKLFNLPFNTLDEPTLTAVIRAAKARKKLAVVHIMAREFARQAVADGADGLVHLFVDKPVDDAFAAPCRGPQGVCDSDAHGARNCERDGSRRTPGSRSVPGPFLRRRIFNRSRRHFLARRPRPRCKKFRATRSSG